jgi:mRNA-degrading endonuclease toxin of MazEF toxin-antitoxin module
MGRLVKRGEVWLAEVGSKRRPVLLLTRSEVLDVRALVTVAEISTSRRGLAAEVDFDHNEAGIDHPSVINCDGLHTVAQTSLTGPLGSVDDAVLRKVCSALNYAVGC